jgi:hypothetical protein
MTLVPLLNPKFANYLCRTMCANFGVRGTSAQYRGEDMITKQDRMLTMAVAARAMTRRPGS